MIPLSNPTRKRSVNLGNNSIEESLQSPSWHGMACSALLCIFIGTSTAFFHPGESAKNISSSSSPSMFFLTGRRSMREQRSMSEQRMSSVFKLHHVVPNSSVHVLILSLSVPGSNKAYGLVLDEKTEQATIKEDSRQLEYPSSSDNIDDLVYHVDYHGVSTHPTPTPKHPKTLKYLSLRFQMKKCCIHALLIQIIPVICFNKCNKPIAESQASDPEFQTMAQLKHDAAVFGSDTSNGVRHVQSPPTCD
ncbi:hypothetical protein NC651_014712 [Populus alba x Populus x berolinensis]|nr:hypothetical protein NC651_014712 [Populus alba x Populus x berolinensis]